ncbi:hypothetical protein [Burkholderia ubonensis]|uniref:hypothetical protein n=1 Tax=Burkholderia ubonensis TaxID=101571 RepID=UPI000755ED25|nr:hypothetical protein [Burkholderia ubonensis]KWC69072.1 hypothetical protein WL53_29735 [Burkholderia ubonensis]
MSSADHERGLEPLARFSDEWRASEAVRCRLRDAPPGSNKATNLPDFQHLTWTDLRDAWSATNYRGKGPLTLEQRFVLEVVHMRRAMRHMDKLVAAAELELKQSGAPDSFALDRPRRKIDVTRFD